MLTSYGGDAKPSLLMTVNEPADLLYGDLGAEEAAKWCGLLKPQAATALASPATNAGHLLVPCAYVITTEDRIWPVEVQEDVIRKAREGGADLRKVFRIESDHSPYLGRVDEVARMIAGFIGELGDDG